VWSIRFDGNDIFLDCSTQPKCYLCGGDYILWKAHKMKFSQDRSEKDMSCHAIDITCVCGNCCLEAVFGIAVSEEEYNKANIMEIPIDER
jgi:hypothetical protein